MTFPAKLERLLKDERSEEMSCKYSRFIVNHADALLDLVRAAEEIASPSGYRDLIVAHNELRYALAKLNGEGK